MMEFTTRTITEAKCECLHCGYSWLSQKDGIKENDPSTWPAKCPCCLNNFWYRAPLRRGRKKLDR